MKSFVKIALGVAAFAFVQPASASSTFTITGPTSFRVAIYDTIIALMGGSPGATPPTTGTAQISTTGSGTNSTPAAGRTALNGNNTVTIQGTITGINGGNPITVYVAVAGSVLAVTNLYNQTTLTYATATATATGYDHIGWGAATTTAPGAPQFSFADNDQASITTTAISGLNGAIVAVQPYVFVANKGSTLTNLTTQGANLLFNNGVVTQSFLTGNAADTHNVYLTGRDYSAGTRVGVVGETKYGLTNLLNQYYVTTTGSTGSGSIVSLRYWPTSGSFGNVDPANAGNGGYGSGSNIASLVGFTSSGTINILNADGSSNGTDTNVSVVGYVGASDALTGDTNGGVRLKYNGVQYTGPSDNGLIQNGAYTLWSYEHLFYKGTLGTDASSLYTKIKGAVGANIGSAGVDIATMIASRSGDGALVGP